MAMKTPGMIQCPHLRTPSVILRCATSHEPTAHQRATPRPKTPVITAISPVELVRKTGVYAAMLSPPLATVTATTPPRPVATAGDEGSAERRERSVRPSLYRPRPRG